MPKRKDPRITEAAQYRLDKQFPQAKKAYDALLAQYKPTRLARMIREEELRLQASA